MKEALFYENSGGNSVRCGLCRHCCRIADGSRGICHVRENRGGTLYSLVYGRVIAEHADPVEKKPLFHFLPGSGAFSIATPGCNFRCRHCQNFSIAQVPADTTFSMPQRKPQEIVESAVRSGCRSIAYTYTEPTIFFEFALDTARLAQKAGMRNIFVTNGYLAAEPLAAIAPYLDAANIDLKAFSEKTYREICGAGLGGVLDSICAYKKHGIWIELTTLIIPGLNDSDTELGETARFIAENTGVDTPWHVSRFHPTFRMTDRPPTPVTSVLRAAAIGRAAGLNYVYTGNIQTGRGENTICPGCQQTVIARDGFTVTAERLQKGCCPDCGAAVAGVW
jgi:pyruvate formate lyase activating enzyme